MEGYIEHFQKGGFLSQQTADHANQVIDAVNAVSPLKGSGPIMVQGGMTGGAVISFQQQYRPQPPFIGIIVDKGPDGQADYDEGDPRYWVRPVYILPDGEPDWYGRIVPTQYEAKDKNDKPWLIRTVTNLAEFHDQEKEPGPVTSSGICQSTPNVGEKKKSTHQLRVGQYVRCWREQNLSAGGGGSQVQPNLEYWVCHQTPETQWQGCTYASNCCTETYGKYRTAVEYDNGFLLADSDDEDETIISLNVHGCSGINTFYSGCCSGLWITWSGLYIESCDAGGPSYQHSRTAVKFGQGLKVSDTTTSGTDCNGNSVQVDEALVELCLQAGSGITITPVGPGDGDYCCYEVGLSGCCYSGLTVTTDCGGATQNGINEIIFGSGLQVGFPGIDQAHVDVCIRAGENVSVTQDGCCYVIAASGTTMSGCAISGAGCVTVSGDCTTGYTISGICATGITISGCNTADGSSGAHTGQDELLLGTGLDLISVGNVALVNLNLAGGHNVSVTNSGCYKVISATGSIDVYDCMDANHYTDVHALHFGNGFSVVDGRIDLNIVAGAGVTVTNSGCSGVIISASGSGGCDCSGFMCNGTPGLTTTLKRITDIVCSGNSLHYASSTDTYCGGILVGTSSNPDTDTFIFCSGLS